MSRLRGRFAIVVCTMLLGWLAAVHAQQPPAKEFEFKGKVEKVDVKAKTLMVAGENVQGWMMAMTMTYAVDKDAVLATLKAGDQIVAKVHDGDFKMLYDVKVVPPKPPAAGQKK